MLNDFKNYRVTITPEGMAKLRNKHKDEESIPSPGEVIRCASPEGAKTIFLNKYYPLITTGPTYPTEVQVISNWDLEVEEVPPEDPEPCPE